MTVDYDLVIIGNTRAARIAAAAAMRWPVRIALVLPPSPVAPHAHIYPHALQQASTLGFHRDPLYPWQYAKTVAERMALQLSTDTLAAQGVDIVAGSGAFVRKPTLHFKTARRSLLAKNYLLAMGSQPDLPNEIPGLNTTGFLTIGTLGEICDRPQVPTRWAIIGDEAVGVEMAQILRQLGYEVLLIVESDQVLPEEDPDAAAAIQFQMEASGIVLITKRIVQEVGQDDNSKFVLVNQRKYHIDEILIATAEVPCVEGFGLGGAKVEYNPGGIGVDDYLQTSNHQIYGCGSICGKVLGGYYGEHLAEYEARLAVHNVLSRRRQPVDYHKIPWTVLSNPPLARVGPTELDARLQFKKRCSVLKLDYARSPRALMMENNNGFVKLIVRRSGQLIGATIVGPGAAEMMQIVSLAIRHKLHVNALSEFPGIALTNTQSVVETARQWQPPAFWLRALDPLLQALTERSQWVEDLFIRWRSRHQPKLRS